MLSSLTEAITSGVSGIMTSVTTAIPVGFDNLLVGAEGNLTNFAEFGLYFIGFGMTVGLARWLAHKLG